MRIFAYGSNMCLTRLTDRVPSARFVSTARLNGYQLRLHKRSSDGSAKANAFETGNENDILHGVIFEINDNEKHLLDEAEGLGHGYDEMNVDVTLHDNSTANTQMYYANINSINDALVPYSWYMDFIVTGAEDFGLPDNYIEALRTIPNTSDLIAQRAKQQSDILLRHRTSAHDKLPLKAKAKK